MKTVHELSEAELNELRETYYYQSIESGGWFSLEINSTEEIPNELIFKEYDGISFVEEDFFCNL